MAENNRNYAKERAEAQIQDYIDRGLAQGSSEVKEFVLRREVWQMPWTELVGHVIKLEHSFYGYLKVNTLSSFAPDPSFNASLRLDELRMDMPVFYWKMANRVQSEQEMQGLLQWAQANEHSKSMVNRSLGVPWDASAGVFVMFIVAVILFVNLSPLPKGKRLEI